MAKQGQHPHDAHVSPGHNNPGKSQEITTGSYKKQETYRKQAALHEDPGKTGQHAKVHEHADTRDMTTHEADSEQRSLDATERSGSESNTDSGTRGH